MSYTSITDIKLRGAQLQHIFHNFNRLGKAEEMF